MTTSRPRGHQLSDADVLLLTRIEAGEHTFRPGSAPRHGKASTHSSSSCAPSGIAG